MVTKGIIISIDFNGNTCQVRIPLFEAAGNDPIIGTAVVSNTPGSYNGYKVGDVVLVAFEDGKMETPVVIGKLYLGAEKEKADPRGSLNTESLVAAKTAAVPADTKLTTDTDKNLPNTMNPYANLSSIANNLNKLNTDVNYLDVFTNNQFSSVITDVNKQGDELRSEIKQTAENIENKVVHKHQDGSQDALGWNLDEKEWKINAQDTVTDENGETKVKDINIVTIDRNGMSIAGDLKLSGYPRNITVRYAQNDSDEHYPDLYKGEEINPKWKTETPARVDGQYIWQWTHTESFSFDGDKWTEQDDDKVVCITGAVGSTGEPATIYWAKLSTAVHTGKNQKSDIEIIPYAKTGSSPEAIDTTAYFKYSLDNGTNWNSKNWTLLQDNKIVISASSIEANNIIVKLAHAYTDPNDSTKLTYSEYEIETITYSPLNTPIIDLTNDTDVIKYKPDGNKITADVLSTAQVYLGGSPEAADYDWAVTSGNATISKSEDKKTITVTEITSDKAIITCTATTTNFKDENGNAVQISKDFVVSREVVVASYWLSFSPVHTGNLQQTDIEVKALAKIGNDNESKDTNAYFRYSWDNGANWIHEDWTKPTNATLIIPKADIQNNNLRVQATHDKNGTPYEDETITYSPLNTPILDLTNDSDAIAYDGNTILGNSVSSTAVVYLNGSTISGCTFAWTATNCTISGATDSSTVTVSAIDDDKSEGTATCKVTLIPNYQDIKLVKVFTVAKQYKGNPGANGPTPTSSTTYYIYSADTPSLDDPKWETDPANLDKPNGGYFCWTKTVTTYSDGKTITDGPNKDAAFALAQGKSTNYYSPTAPSVNIQKGDCWFDTSIAGKETLKQWDGSAWQDIGGELVANKVTANYINALDITAKKITVLDGTNPVFIANTVDPASGSYDVNIGGFSVDSSTLLNGTFGADKSVLVSTGYKNKSSIGGSKVGEEKEWAFVAGNKFGVTTTGELFASSITISGYATNKALEDATNDAKSHADNVANDAKSYADTAANNAKSYADTAASEAESNAISTIEGKGYQTETGVTTITEKTIKTTNVIAENLQVKKLLVKDSNENVLLDAGASNQHTVQIGGFTVGTSALEAGTSGTSNYVKLGTDGIKLGTNFSIDSAGAIWSTSGTIGGFTVDSNRLYAGTPGLSSGIELSSVGLIAYRSNNQGIDSSYAVSKITVTKATNILTVYIRTEGEFDCDYTMISNPNASSYPKDYSDNNVKAYTLVSQNSSSTLAGYTKVEYSDLKQGDHIYIVYRKDISEADGADTGYLLIPETADVSISNVDANDTKYYFVRDSAFDINGASITVGANFSVVGSNAYLESSDKRMPTSAVYSRTHRIDDCAMGFKDSSGSYSWVEFKPNGYYTYSASNSTDAVITGKISYTNLKKICWLNTYLGQQQYTGSRATCPQIIVLEASITRASYTTYDLSTYGINEIIGAQITEKRTTAKSDWDRQWFVVDDETKTKITIYNNSTETKTFSVLVIAI